MRSLRTVVVVAYLVCQLMMVLVLVGSDLDAGRAGGLMLGCFVVAIIAVSVGSGRVPLILLLCGTYVLVPLNWMAVDSMDDALTFATAWFWNLGAITPVFIMRSRRSIVLAIAGAVVATAPATLAHPGWGVDLTISAFGTAMAILVVGRFAASFLWSLADQLDAEAEALGKDIEELARLTSSGRELADNARVLHDTVINTLGAIADGGTVIGDHALVRERCASDLRTVERLLDIDDDALGLDMTLTELLNESRPIAVKLTGIDRPGLARWEETLAPRTRRALVGAVRELLLNVVKHAHATCVEIDVMPTPTAWRLTVRDDGVGMRYGSEQAQGRGLEESVVARLVEVGAMTRIDSVPGVGTTVVLSSGDGEHDTGRSAVVAELEKRLGGANALAQIERRSCWAWAAGVVVIGVVIELINRRGELTATYAALGVAAMVALAAWFDLRRRDELSLPVIMLLVLGAPATYVLSFAGVGFGSTDAFTWQSLIATVPGAILRVNKSDGRAFRWSVVAVVCTAVVTSVIVWMNSRDAGVLALVGAVVTIAVVWGWSVFHRQIGVVAERVAADHRRAARVRADVAARRAAAVARRRWQTGGLRSCVEALRDVASGALSPDDEAMRERCGEDERHLRQLIMLSPDAFRMSEWFAQGLADARARGVVLTLRSGDCDAADDVAAERLGRILLDAIAAVQVGDELTVSLVESSGRTQMSLVGPQTAMVDAGGRWEPPPGWHIEHLTLGDVDLVEIREDCDEEETDHGC